MCNHVVSTPLITHLGEYKSVYEPSQDSFLFIDALERDYELIKESDPAICVEIGCGSGIVITSLSSVLGPSSFYIAVDINPEAVQCTKETLSTHSVLTSDYINDSMLTSLMPRLAGAVDILLFNPPYVPTPSDEVGGVGLSSSWAGGKDGREVIDCLLPSISCLLSDSGIFYLVTVKENRPDDICQYLMKSFGLFSQTVITRRAYNEHLSVLRFSKKKI